MAHHRAGKILLTVSFVLFGAGLPLLAQGDGTLDPSFGTGGKMALDPGLYENVTATVVAPDGRLVIVGERNTLPGGYWAILDDAGVGAPCVAESPEGSTGWTPHAAAFDPAGRLVLVGAAFRDDTGTQGFVLRYLYPACTLDTGFNLNGIFRTGITGGDGVVFNAIAFGASSKPIIAGSFYEFGFGGHPLVFRLTSSGLFDLNFGESGEVSLDLGGNAGFASSVAIQADGAVVVGGHNQTFDSSTQFFVARLDVDGELDPGFGGGDGVVQVIVPTEVHEGLWDLAIDPVSGDILAAGGSGAGIPYPVKLKVVRLRPNGALNDDFDDDGIWTAQVPDGGTADAIDLQSDGKILVGGYREHPATTGYDFVVHRLFANGDADSSFGNLGITEVSFGLDPSIDDYVLASTLHGGRLVAAGYAWDWEAFEARAIVARLWSDLIFTDGFERGSAGGWGAGAP